MEKSMHARLLHSLHENFNAVVIGASGGLGTAICDRLKLEPGICDLTELSRRRDGFDIADEASIARHADRLSAKPIDLLICATGVLTLDGKPPEKALRQIDPEAMLTHFRINSVGPALVAKHFLPLLSRRSRSIAAFLSARVGSIGDNHLGGWISYRSSKAAMNQIVRTAAIEMARTHPAAIVTAIHPGTVRTPLSNPYSSGHRTMSPDESASSILRALDDLKDTGSFVAYDGHEIEW
jgi:NAD(P)-dependent dehydrogenase (short-subunit alcohol dehydrogenase family)